MNFRVEVHQYKNKYGEGTTNDSLGIALKMNEIIRNTITPRDTQLIDVYNMGGRKQNFTAGRRDRMVMYIDSDFIEYPRDTVIVTDEVREVATYSKTRNEMNIFLNMSEEYDDETLNEFKRILSLVQEQVYEKEELRRSWVHSDQRGELLNSFVERINRQNVRRLEEDKQRIEHFERNIKEMTRDIKNNYDRIISLRNQIEATESGTDGVEEKITKELDLVKGIEQIEDIRIEQGVVTLHTKPIYAYASRTGRRYLIGRMTISLDLLNTYVKFFNKDNRRRSYWSRADHHPHVNGDSGEACLGNVATTIAELCSQHELYALSLVAIDFLENANEEDVAGRNVLNWQEVDEDGNEVHRTEEEMNEGTFYCENCDDRYDEDEQDSYVVYNGETDGELHGEAVVCEGCRENEYYYSDHFDEYVHHTIEEQEDN